MSLAKLRFLEVEVVARSGQPVDRPIVLVAELEEDARASAFRPVEVHADTLGRTRLLLPPDKDWVVAARHGSVTGYSLVLADESRVGQARAEAVMVFLDGPVVSGQVQNAAGDPVAGLKLWVDAMESTSEDDLHVRLTRALAACFRHGRTHPIAVTDERGAFSLKLPIEDVRVWFVGRGQKDGAAVEVDGGWVYPGSGNDDVKLTGKPAAAAK